MPQVFQPFFARPSGGWNQLVVTPGKDFGLAQRPSGDTSFLVSLFFNSSGPATMQVPCAGRLYCSPGGMATTDERSAAQLSGIFNLTEEQLDGIRAGVYDSLLVRQPPPSTLLSHTGSVRIVFRPSPTNVRLMDEALATGFGDVTHVIYDAVDVASLKALILPLSGGPLYVAASLLSELSEDQVFTLFLLGLITLDVDPFAPGNASPPVRLSAVGNMATSGGSPSVRLTVETSRGAIDPVWLLHRLNARGYLSDPDGFLTSPPATAGFTYATGVAGSHSAAPSINRTAFLNTMTVNYIYPFSVLKALKDEFEQQGAALTDAEWRQVGDNQKVLYRTRLTNSPDQFLGENWREDSNNIFALEAIVEHFCVEAVPQSPVPTCDGVPVQRADQRVTANFLAREDIWERRDNQATQHRSDLFLVQIDPYYLLGAERDYYKTSIRAGTSGSEFDEYDGVMFIIAGGEVQFVWPRFSSLTSKRNTGEGASSIEGNRKYRVFSQTSSINMKEGGTTHVGHNYSFLVADSLNMFCTSGLPGWYYWGTTNKAAGEWDPNGKGAIMLHRGNYPGSTSGWHGSEGCQVGTVPTYYGFRRAVIEAWLSDHPSEPGLERVRDMDQKRSERTWQDTVDHMYLQYLVPNDPSFWEFFESGRKVEPPLRPEQWDGKIYGTYFLVRPDEYDRSVGGTRYRLLHRITG